MIKLHIRRSKSISYNMPVVPNIPLVDVFLIINLNKKENDHGKDCPEIIASYPSDSTSKLEGINLVECYYSVGILMLL